MTPRPPETLKPISVLIKFAWVYNLLGSWGSGSRVDVSAWHSSHSELVALATRPEWSLAVGWCVGLFLDVGFGPAIRNASSWACLWGHGPRWHPRPLYPHGGIKVQGATLKGGGVVLDWGAWGGGVGL